MLHFTFNTPTPAQPEREERNYRLREFIREAERDLIQHRSFQAFHKRHAERLETVAHLDRRPVTPHYAPAVKKAAPRVDRAAAFREVERQKFRAANNAAVGDVRARFAARQAHIPHNRRPLHSPKL